MSEDEIIINDEAPSSLPPLNQSPRDSGPALSLLELKNEIKKLYPCVQKIEKNVESVKQQIPVNLSRALLQTSIDLQKLRGISKTSFSSEEPHELNTNNDLSNRLKDIENRLLLHLDISVRRSKNDVERKISSLIKKSELINEEPLFVEEPIKESDIVLQINQLKTNFAQQENRFNSRLSMVEKSYENFKLDNRKTDLLKKYMDNVEIQKAQVIELNYKLDDVAEKIRQINKSQNISSNSQKKKQKEAETANLIKPAFESQPPPDISDDVGEIQNEIQNLVQNFGQSLENLHSRSQEYEQKVKRLSALAADLNSRTVGLEGRIQDVDSQCQTIIAQLSEITKKTEDNTCQNELAQISEEIKRVHEDIQNEIKTLRSRAKLCETSIPKL